MFKEIVPIVARTAHNHMALSHSISGAFGVVVTALVLKFDKIIDLVLRFASKEQIDAAVVKAQAKVTAEVDAEAAKQLAAKAASAQLAVGPQA